MHHTAHGKGNRVRLNGVAVPIGDNAVNLAVCPLLVHFDRVAVASEAGGLSEHGRICVLVVPAVGQAITGGF